MNFKILQYLHKIHFWTIFSLFYWRNLFWSLMLQRKNAIDKILNLQDSCNFYYDQFLMCFNSSDGSVRWFRELDIYSLSSGSKIICNAASTIYLIQIKQNNAEFIMRDIQQQKTHKSRNSLPRNRNTLVFKRNHTKRNDFIFFSSFFHKPNFFFLVYKNK